MRPRKAGDEAGTGEVVEQQIQRRSGGLVRRHRIGDGPAESATGAHANQRGNAGAVRRHNLIYVNAPGYGTDGPFGHRPAYAPSIGAAAGLTLGDFPAVDQTFANINEIKRAAAQLSAASAIPPLQADGIAALGVASTMLLGLVGRARGKHVGELTSTMISTAAIAIFRKSSTTRHGHRAPAWTPRDTVSIRCIACTKR